jgi:hypothetical protein
VCPSDPPGDRRIQAIRFGEDLVGALGPDKAPVAVVRGDEAVDALSSLIIERNALRLSRRGLSRGGRTGGQLLGMDAPELDQTFWWRATVRYDVVGRPRGDS